MLKGIDISNYQKTLQLYNLVGQIDFVIMKATEGLNIVDASCDRFFQQAKKYGLLKGFYHVFTSADPVKQADYLVDNTINYFGDAIPVLDVEGVSSYYPSNATNVLKFVQRVEQRTGVKPIIYMNTAAKNASDYISVVKNGNGLWGANYYFGNKRVGYSDVDASKHALDAKPWPFMAIWQFTSSGRLLGYEGNLDLDLAFMDKSAWVKYQGVKNPSKNLKPQVEGETLNVSGSKYNVTIKIDEK